MRLFFAIEADPATRAALTAAAERYRPLTGKARWTQRENLHLTLHFLGEYPESALPVLETVLSAAAAGLSPFSLTVCGAGTFGRRDDILWLGLAACLDRSHPLQRLYHQLQQALAAAGLPGDNRPYAPHITIAREVRLLPPAGWPDLAGAPSADLASAAASADRGAAVGAADRENRLPGLYQPFAWPVTGISLMHSTQFDGRLTYRCLAFRPLYI